MPPKTQEPIFFAVTRSFLLGLFPALLTGMDMLSTLFTDDLTARPVAMLLSMLFSGVSAVTGLPCDWDAVAVHAFMVGMLPVFAAIIAHQRSGAARPYTIDPSKTK